MELFLPGDRLTIYLELLKRIGEINENTVPHHGLCRLIENILYPEGESSISLYPEYDPFFDRGLTAFPEINEQLRDEEEDMFEDTHGYYWSLDYSGWMKRYNVVNNAIKKVTETISQINKPQTNETVIQSLI